MHACQETETRPNTDRPQSWIGCLGCYGAGRLVGQWFDAEECPVEMGDFEKCGVFLPWVHVAEEHEELWVFDHENFGGVLTGECSPSEAQRLASIIQEANDRCIPTEALAHWISDGHDTDDVDELLDGLQDAYCGQWDSGADYAQELADDIGAVPQDVAWPTYCIDWTRAWHELEAGGDNFAVRGAEGGFLIFRGV